MRTAKVLFIAMMVVAFATASWAGLADHVVINELKVKSTEHIELYNPTGAPVDVTDWILSNLFPAGEETLSGVIAAGGFMDVVTTLALSNTGDVVTLRDDGGVVIDQVGYGANGGADLGFNSMGRFPDGNDTDDDARDWNYAHGGGSETFGSANVNKVPVLGTTLVINEISLNPDKIELYNASGGAIDATGWIISDGDGYCPIGLGPHVIPAGGVKGFGIGAGTEIDCASFDAINFSTTDVAYLYRPDGSKVDQLGWFTSPPPDSFSVSRCTDGFGPNDGYDSDSSGRGWATFVTAFSFGASNNAVCSIGVEESTWGQIKSRYNKD